MRFVNDRSTNNLSIHTKWKNRRSVTSIVRKYRRRSTIIENYINAGIVLADANEIEKAERFPKALTIDPKNGVVFYNLANVYYNHNVIKNLLNYINKHYKQRLNKLIVII